ncbi:MAG: sulfatase [Isosphaeraceae bacterium]
MPPAPTTDLPRAERTLAELFRDHGYATLHVGKWHLGDAAESPEVHGFDVNIGGTHWGAPATYFHPFRGLQRNGEYRYVPGLGVGKKGDELTDRLTDEALALLDQVRDRPFFLNLWYHTPHTPIEAKPELTARFRAKLRPELKHQNPAYAAMVASLDANVGRVLDYLEAHDLARNTLVVFTSDNGGYVGTFDHLPVTSNAPLRSGKGSLYEGGIRVPTLVRWPGVIPAGTQSREPLTCTDFWPTFHSLLGDPISPSDGLNLLPLWKDPSVRLAREALFFHYPHYYDTTTPASAVRAGNAKLIHYFEDDRVELYDLAGDPGETTNRAPNDPATAARLRSLLDAWRREVGAQMPKINASYRPPGTARP